VTDRPKGTAYDRAISLLARRPHFAAELQRKLEQRGYSSEEVEAAIARLRADGYLDDPALAREYVATKAARSGIGKARARFELSKRGLGEEVVREAVTSVLPEVDLEGAREAARKWSRTHRPNPPALGRHLQRKGFSTRAIVRVLQDLGETDPSSPSPAPEEMEE
jgi:regulatory protein